MAGNKYDIESDPLRASFSFQTIYMGALLSFVYCVFNTTLVLLTTTEIRINGKYLLINFALKICKLCTSSTGEDQSGVTSGSVPTVRVSMNSKQGTQMTNILPMKPSTMDIIENDISVVGKQRVHFIDHDKPLKVPVFNTKVLV